MIFACRAESGRIGSCWMRRRWWGHLVPAASLFAFLAAHRGELFADEDFADLFPSGRGRPSVPASVMASVMVLQVLHDYSDAEAAGAARCDLRWKAPCGFPLDHGGFGPPTPVFLARRPAAVLPPGPPHPGGPPARCPS